MDPPQAVGPPEWLIDPQQGVVWLRLAPYHLERLHGPYPAERSRGDAALHAGLPFPLKGDAPPFDVHFRQGMKPDDARLDLEWQWHAYALTPFGWVPFPQALFRHGRLQAVTLQPQVTRGTLETYLTVATWLNGELGPPHVKKSRPPLTHRNENPSLWASIPGRQEWQYTWGTVVLGFDPRDFETYLSVRWGRSKSTWDVLKKLFR
jgi:hypothetical protein